MVFNKISSWANDTIVEPLQNHGQEAYNDGKDLVEDLSNEADKIVVDLLNEGEEIGTDLKDFCEQVEDTVERKAAIYEGLLYYSKESFEDFLDDTVETADKTWDAFVDGTTDTWFWLEENVDDGVDWMFEAADKVYDFIVEEAIPYIVLLVEFIPHLATRIIGNIPAFLFCFLYKEIFGDEEATVIQGIATHEPRLMEEFRVARIPVNRKYVVFSDVHMYIEGDLDFFNNNGNSEIYRTALQWYSEQGYHLIENGDIEDFWMRGGSSKGLIFTMGENLPWPYYSEVFESSAFRAANQTHALNMFANNANTYSVIRTSFHDKGRYTRLIGNHDDVWANPSINSIIKLFYPGIVVNDYCTLERHGKTEVILAHGHQSDSFNTPMCNFAGKSITKLFSTLHELTFGEFNKISVSKDEWESEWKGKGFSNELTEIDLVEGTSLDEYDLYEGIYEYLELTETPSLILGHTHHPKSKAGIPLYIHWYDGKYSNSGSVGLWEGIVVGLEVESPDDPDVRFGVRSESYIRPIHNIVEYPDVRVVAWKKEEDGTIGSYELLKSREDYGGDFFLKPIAR
jgi:UDP-2,3-diacylglucosamine pyrophosphatase LpxH